MHIHLPAGARRPSLVLAALYCLLQSPMLFAEPVGATPQPSRGELLYEVSCSECHAREVHWRTKKSATTPERLHREIARWRDNVGAAWNNDDTEAVFQYLNDAYYRLPEDPVAKAPNPPVQRSDTMRLTSTAFAHESAIPPRHTCQGSDQSPPLSWADLPAGTRSLALIVDDPDAPDPKAPKMTWVHWVLYNLPPTSGGLPQGVDRAQLPKGTLEGLNDWQRTGYGGPCPPIGRHRYFHKLYALDVVLPDLSQPAKAALEAAMQGHILAVVQLIGTYEKR